MDASKLRYRILKDIQLALTLRSQGQRFDLEAVKDSIHEMLDYICQQRIIEYNSFWQSVQMQCEDLEIDTTQLEIELSFAQAEAV